ncbi:beta-carotene 15,15'-monooxygenase [Albibacterium sp.]|uniref:beta-carotene 15,15'-monooxygenase n=1 Tax=Albibacterium sp. TaxID=2952885 RepID=UPI002CD2BA67|nr:beta-carotene 15,15'-monooxygenase [Albibacterium sp.]HUH19682.1 hypothetical protein [Albibacterium sp.]
MIEYLKESTFVINDVISDAWDVLKKRYFAIAGICFLLFVVSNVSGILAMYLNSISIVLSVFMALLFLVVYFGLQLALFKHIFQVLDRDQEDIRWRDSIPELKELIYFFACVVSILVGAFITYLLISVIFFPLIYLISVEVMVQIVYFITFVLAFSMFLRIAFFPFFILDKGVKPFKAIRLSLATTRGNFIRIVLLLAFFALFGSLYLYFSYRGYAVISTGLSMVNSFVIVPLSSVAFIIAYRKMMRDYRGDADPSIMENII